MGYLARGMFWLREVQIQNAGCLACGMFEIWVTWEKGYLGFLIFGTLDVWDVECPGCGMSGIWAAWDVECLGCEISGTWDVWNVGCKMFVGIWDISLQNHIYTCRYT